MIDFVLDYIKEDYKTMREIKKQFNIKDDRHLRIQFENYNSKYCPNDRPRYIVSDNVNGYKLTTDTILIKKSADYHMRLALNHLQKYWNVVKIHETKDNLMLDIQDNFN